jgi:hypothetical protein
VTFDNRLRPRISDHERQARLGPKPDPVDRRVEGLGALLGFFALVELFLVASTRTSGSRPVLTRDDLVAVALVVAFGIAALLARLRAARTTVIGVLVIVDGLIFASLILGLEAATPWFPIGAIVSLAIVTGTMSILRTYPDDRWKARRPGRFERRT